MKYISGILLTGLLLILIHCMNNHHLEKTINATLDHLMSLHDSTMHQNSVAGNLIEELKKIKAIDSTKITLVDSIRTELDASNETMMDWMANYVEPLTKDSAALLYLHKQIELLQQLASSQEQNIRQAKNIIQQTSN